MRDRARCSYASVYARTFETIEGPIVNPSDFEEIPEVNLASSRRAVNYPHMPGFEEYDRKSKKGKREANRANLSK